MRARLSRLAPEEIAVIPLLVLGAIALLLQPAALARLAPPGSPDPSRVPTVRPAPSPSVAVVDPIAEATFMFDRTVPLPLRMESMRARVILTIPEFGGWRAPPAGVPVLPTQPRFVEH